MIIYIICACIDEMRSLNEHVGRIRRSRRFSSFINDHTDSFVGSWRLLYKFTSAEHLAMSRGSSG